LKIGILSDTHNQIARTAQAVAMLQSAGAERLVHCGDISEPELIPIVAVLPTYFTFGNHDADMVRHLDQAIAAAGSYSLGWGDVIELGGKRLGVAHGHMHLDIRRIMALQPDYLLSGHLHFPVDRMQDGVRRICPGALHRAEQFTVALLELETGELQLLTVPDADVLEANSGR
jgi:putative phosphoesterase